MTVLKMPPLPNSKGMPVPPKRPAPLTGGGTVPPKINLPKPPVISNTDGKPAPISLPGMQKNTNAPSANNEEQKNALEKLEVLKNTIKDIQEDTKKETQEDSVTETVTQEPSPETIITEKTTEETSKETVEPKQEPVQTEAPKRTRRKKDENKEAPAIQANVSSEEVITIELKPTCKDFQIMENALCNTFNDPEWEAEKESIALENSKIVIDEDMNPSSLKIKVAQLCALRDRIYLDYCKFQTNFQNLVSDKPEGIIERTKRMHAKGSNDFERRKNGIVACMQYEINGEMINLFELLEQTRERYYFYKAIMDNIEWKSKTIITMNSAILMEQKLEK